MMISVQLEHGQKTVRRKDYHYLFALSRAKQGTFIKDLHAFIPAARHNTPHKLKVENLPGQKKLTGKVLESIDNKRFRSYFPNRSRKASINGGKTL